MQAVAYLHHKLICHRDIKPENILVCIDQQTSAVNLKLIDFNISQKCDDDTF